MEKYKAGSAHSALTSYMYIFHINYTLVVSISVSLTQFTNLDQICYS